MHLCIVATLCFFKIISPRNYYLATRTFFPGSMVQSVDLNLTVANVFRILYSRCQKFPYLSKYKYQQSYSVEDLTVTHQVLSNHLMILERKHGYALQLSEMPTIVIISNSGKKGMEKGKAMQDYILLSKTLEKKYGLMI